MPVHINLRQCIFIHLLPYSLQNCIKIYILNDNIYEWVEGRELTVYKGVPPENMSNICTIIITTYDPPTNLHNV